MTDGSPKTMGEAVEKVMADQPTFVNYGRVFLDVIMTIILTAVVISAVGNNKDSEFQKKLVHDVPIYMKKGMMTGDLWNKQCQIRCCPMMEKR